MNFSKFDIQAEGPEKLFALYRRVYGDDQSLRRRWQWEWVDNPDADKVTIYIAEDAGQIVGMTVRLPCNLQLQGKSVSAFFATNSMVDPAYRGKGIIHDLYSLAQKTGDLQLSKGTADGMYRLLLKMGYQVVKPDTFQICLLRPVKWLAIKSGIKSPAIQQPKTPLKGFDEFKVVEKFVGIESVRMGESGFVEKDDNWLNWRYVQIPYQNYHKVVRYKNRKPVAWCVIRHHGQTAHLVDLAWDQDLSDEPQTTISFAKAFAKSLGAVKIIAWGACRAYRHTLFRYGFMPRRETPRFSFYVTPEIGESLLQGKAHIVQGDGDIDYL